MTHSRKKTCLAEPTYEAQSGNFMAKLSEPFPSCRGVPEGRGVFPRLTDYQDYKQQNANVGATQRGCPADISNRRGGDLSRPAMMYATTQQYTHLSESEYPEFKLLLCSNNYLQNNSHYVHIQKIPKILANSDSDNNNQNGGSL
jgi:hypothetical protein